MGSPYISSYGEEAALLQRIADLEAAHNGGSTPVVAYAFASADADAAANAAFVLDSLAGDDAGVGVSIDGSGHLLFAEDGFYQVTIDTRVASKDAGVDTLGVYLDMGGTPLPANSYQNFGGGENAFPPFVKNVTTFPATPFAAGNTLAVHATVEHGSGAASLTLLALVVARFA